MPTLIPPLLVILVIWCVCLQVDPGAVKLRPRRSQEVRGCLELQNGGPRALNEAWMMTFWLRHFSVKFGRFLSLWALACRAGREGGLAQSQEVTRRALLQHNAHRVIRKQGQNDFEVVPNYVWSAGGFRKTVQHACWQK